VSAYPDRYLAVLGLVYCGDPAAAGMLDAHLVDQAPLYVLRRLCRNRTRLVMNDARRRLIDRVSRAVQVHRHHAGPLAETSAANAPPVPGNETGGSCVSGSRIGSSEPR
jgi:hypothetical protein